MAQLLLVLIGALVVGAVVFGVAVLITGEEGLEGVEPDGRSIPLTTSRPLVEQDLVDVRFDTVVRGYRMAQVDEAIRRAAYDIGYKSELITVLEAEVEALRDGRIDDADELRATREEAAEQPSTGQAEQSPSGQTEAEGRDAGVGSPATVSEEGSRSDGQPTDDQAGSIVAATSPDGELATPVVNDR